MLIFEDVVFPVQNMAEAKRMRYSDSLDHDLMDQVCMINPWCAGNTWDDVVKAAKSAQPAFNTLTTKSLMDRANLLMKKRKEAVCGELRG